MSMSNSPPRAPKRKAWSRPVYLDDSASEDEAGAPETQTQAPKQLKTAASESLVTQLEVGASSDSTAVESSVNLQDTQVELQGTEVELQDTDISGFDFDFITDDYVEPPGYRDPPGFVPTHSVFGTPLDETNRPGSQNWADMTIGGMSPLVLTEVDGTEPDEPPPMDPDPPTDDHFPPTTWQAGERPPPMEAHERALNFCCVLNNPTPQEITAGRNLVSGSDGRVACVEFGKEVGSIRGTPHLQIYIRFSMQKTWRAALKYIHDNWSPRIACLERCVDVDAYQVYIRKQYGGAQCESFGNPPRKRVAGTKPQALTAPMVWQCATWSDALRLPGAQNKMPWLQAIWAQKPFERKNVITELRPDQQIAWDMIQEMKEREIFIWVDPAGAAGKSAFAKYLEKQLGYENCLITQPCEGRDFACIYKSHKMVVFDCPRATDQDKIPYVTIEALCDGTLVSPKYASHCHRFDPPKIILLMNTPPCIDKLTWDRQLYHPSGGFAPELFNKPGHEAHGRRFPLWNPEQARIKRFDAQGVEIPVVFSDD